MDSEQSFINNNRKIKKNCVIPEKEEKDLKTLIFYIEYDFLE
jgi:hypothetical protein